MPGQHDDSPDTRAIHADRALNTSSAVSPPIYQSSTFAAAHAAEFLRMATEPRYDRFYTRHGNPNHRQAAAVVAELEGTETALIFGSGMSAISTTVLSLAGAGDHVVAQRNHYAGTSNLLEKVLPRFGVEVSRVDQTVPGNIEQAIKANTRLILLETPSNPLLELVDLAEVATIARARGVITAVDSTFATPINQRPASLGIDLVLHSGTKYLGGHSDLLAGVLAGSTALVEHVWETSLILGGVSSPFDSWLLLRGLRTLGMRVARHNETAWRLALFIEKHPAVERVYYPGIESHPQHEVARRQMSGFGGMLAIVLAGGYAAAELFVSSLRLASRAASLGGVETLVAHPAAMWAHDRTEEQLAAAGIGPGLVRLSVGLEGTEDLLADVSQALDQALAASAGGAAAGIDG
jgi:cystathionine beta-lyase/cystathionine gamma-synthase